MVSKLFYKFLVSLNFIKFTRMKLLDDEDMETMPAEDLTPLSEEYRVQDLCTKVPRASVDRQSFVRDFDIDLNASLVSENLNSGPHLQIHLVLLEVNVDGEDGYDNNGPSNHEVEDYSDLNLDEVSDDIDDEGVNNDRNVYAFLVRNLTRGILICNDPRYHMSILDPDAVHAFEFHKYPDILPIHRLATDPKREELFVGQIFETKKDYIFSIKRHDPIMVRTTNYNREEEFSTECFGHWIHASEPFPTASCLYRYVYYICHITNNFYQDYKNADWRKQVVNMEYELEQHYFKQRLTRLEGNKYYEMNTPFQEWLGIMKPWQWAQSFDDEYQYGYITINLVKTIKSVLNKPNGDGTRVCQGGQKGNGCKHLESEVDECRNIFSIVRNFSSYGVYCSSTRIPPKSYGVDL
ncbi:hypothetical protein GOBAR_AA19291 [Gossypium barbadense]|uniref:Uncharacterized protein n=1 Tax=Gossypium barbadense TaxID=3634 RepID=A0A2P5XDG6_GOSBA|nr:hypothetical protein GOBAR_AA19291 [Gossypium barbadense]